MRDVKLMIQLLKGAAKEPDGLSFIPNRDGYSYHQAELLEDVELVEIRRYHTDSRRDTIAIRIKDKGYALVTRLEDQPLYEHRLYEDVQRGVPLKNAVPAVPTKRSTT